MRLQKYDHEVQYERGTNLYLADTLSRAYLPTTFHPTGAQFENINATEFFTLSASRLREIQQATENDEILQAQKGVILRGWPDDRSQIPEQITTYFSLSTRRIDILRAMNCSYRQPTKRHETCACLTPWRRKLFT